MTAASVAAAVAAIQRGDVVGLPTDTLYGIAADPLNAAAVEALFAIKGRDASKAIPVLAASAADLDRVACIDGLAFDLAARFWPGGLTLVVQRRSGAPEWIGDPLAGTVAVRVPDHLPALAVLAATGPLAITSANRSGRRAAVDAAGAEAIFGPAVAVYVPGRSGGDAASTIVDVTGATPRVLRAGPVAWPRDE